MPTLCAESRIQLVQPGIHFDVQFRMLEPRELANAMGFNGDDQRYEFSGTKTDVIKKIGNAVPCKAAPRAGAGALCRTRPLISNHSPSTVMCPNPRAGRHHLGGVRHMSERFLLPALESGVPELSAALCTLPHVRSC
jgi:hypothetical protein